MKDERVLLAMLASTSSLESLATTGRGASTSTVAGLSAIHAKQVDVITRLVREGGVPESMIRVATTTGPTGRPTPPATTRSHSVPPVTRAAALAAAERESAREVTLANLSKVHVTVIGSMLAQRMATAEMLGSAAPPIVPPGLKGVEAVRLLAAFRAAVYGFEVVAAQIDVIGRAPATSTLAWLRTRVSELRMLVGSTSAPSPLGYELPFPVTNGDSARRLARQLLESLLTDQAAALEPSTGDGWALATIVQWLGTTAVVASRWGVTLTAFPGLTNASDPSLNSRH
jgi:hypothetical protein